LIKEKYKEAIRAYRIRRRQDHIETESLKVQVDLQNSELSELRNRLWAQPIAVTEESAASSERPASGEIINYNLQKCDGIAECLSTLCTRIKRKELLDPDEVLGANMNQIVKVDDKPLDETIDALASKMEKLHSKVIDLYGDELAEAVTCNVQ